MKVFNIRNKPCIILGDLHVPAHHPDSFEFIKALKKHYKNPLIISIGDECDLHSVSMHDKNPNLQSPKDEYEEILYEYHRKGGLYDIAPTLQILTSNHGDLYLRRAEKFGLPQRVIRDRADIWETKGWKWHEEVLLRTVWGDIYLTHGRSKNALKLLNFTGAYGVCQGHFHSKFGIDYYSRSKGLDRFTAFTGCLIDENKLNFKYGSLSIERPQLGSLAIMDDGRPRLHKLNLDKHGRWTGKL